MDLQGQRQVVLVLEVLGEALAAQGVHVVQHGHGLGGGQLGKAKLVVGQQSLVVFEDALPQQSAAVVVETFDGQFVFLGKSSYLCFSICR